MFIDNKILDFAFEGTLFILFAYKLYGLIISYVIPYLSAQMIQIQKKQTEFLEKDKLLMSTIKRIDNQTSHQKKMFVVMEKKVRQWNNALYDKRLKKERDRKAIFLRVLEKRRFQEKRLAISKTATKAIPRAIKETQAEIEKLHYTQHGAELLHSFIMRLQKTEQSNR